MNTLLRVLLCLLIFTSSCLAEINLATLRQNSPDFYWSKLERGEVVWRGLPHAEKIDAELVGAMGVKVFAPMKDVVEYLQRPVNGSENWILNVGSESELKESLAKFSFRGDESVDISWFYEPEADGTFNVSRDELERLQQVALKLKNNTLSQSQALAAMEAEVEAILSDRVKAYRAEGVSAITPYDIDGEKIYPGEYLQQSMRNWTFLQRQEPKFYQAFSRYPDVDSSAYAQQFFLTREIESGRPLLSLKHWMVEARPQMTLIAERKFYISHSLDAMHTLILALEQGGYTYVFLLNQSFTQKVTGMGSFIAHKVGRSQVKANVLPIFEGLKAEFSKP